MANIGWADSSKEGEDSFLGLELKVVPQNKGRLLPRYKKGTLRVIDIGIRRTKREGG